MKNSAYFYVVAAFWFLHYKYLKSEEDWDYFSLKWPNKGILLKNELSYTTFNKNIFEGFHWRAVANDKPTIYYTAKAIVYNA